MKKNKPFVLIMAGGSGTRLWPLSRIKRPKQLIPLYSQRSLIEETIIRAKKITPLDNIIIGTNKDLMGKILASLDYLKHENFLIEPVARNTAPIIAYFLAWLRENKVGEDVPVLVLSADHFISPVEAWAKTVEDSFPHLESRIWCFGVHPSRPETGYGYIERGQNLGFPSGWEIKGFKEKPDAQTAGKYLADGKFLWNSGMFLARLGAFWEEFQKHQTEMAGLAEKIAGDRKKLKEYFPQMPNIAVDYAIMEKTRHAGVLTGDFGWDDVGSYESIPRIMQPDENGNYNPTGTKYYSLKSSGNIIISDEKKMAIALEGVENSLVVYNKGILAISSRKDVDGIKKIRELFDEKYR